VVLESFAGQHGVFVGDHEASGATAAATGDVGVTRRDPDGMLPFGGFTTWRINLHCWRWEETTETPKIFHVNWFRRALMDKILCPVRRNVARVKWLLERWKAAAPRRSRDRVVPPKNGDRGRTAGFPRKR